MTAEVAGGRVRLAMESDYPWDGRVAVRIVETPESAWTLSLRVPAWCRDGRVEVAGDTGAFVPGPGRIELQRRWSAGDLVVLDLAMPARITEPDPRIDAVRGCVALERGPLVYCLEDADLPSGTSLEQLELAPSANPVRVARPDLGPGVIGLSLGGLQRDGGSAPWPYRDAGAGEAGGPATAGATPVELAAIPYLAWANRTGGTMRVWIPRGA